MTKINIPEDSPQALKDLVARAEKTEGDAEKHKVVSARDRLMRYLNKQTFDIVLSEEEGDVIAVRLLTPKEQEFITELSAKMALKQRELGELRNSPVKTKKEGKKLSKNIQKIIDETEVLFDQQNIFLAAITVDEDLDFEFWKTGDAYPTYLAAYVIGEALRRSYDSTRERIAQAEFFRDNGTR